MSQNVRLTVTPVRYGTTFAFPGHISHASISNRYVSCQEVLGYMSQRT